MAREGLMDDSGYHGFDVRDEEIIEIKSYTGNEYKVNYGTLVDLYVELLDVYGVDAIEKVYQQGHKDGFSEGMEYMQEKCMNAVKTMKG